MNLKYLFLISIFNIYFCGIPLNPIQFFLGSYEINFSTTFKIIFKREFHIIFKREFHIIFKNEFRIKINQADSSDGLPGR